MITQTIILSALTYGTKPVIHAMQSDTGRNLQIGFSDYTIPDEATAELYVARPDETFYTITATVNDQVVVAELDQAVTCAGDVECNLAILLNSEKVQSFPFIIRVLATAEGSPQTEQEGVSVGDLADDLDALDDRVEILEDEIADAADGTIYTYDEDNATATISLSDYNGTAELKLVRGNYAELSVTDPGLPGGRSITVNTSGIHFGINDGENWTYTTPIPDAPTSDGTYVLTCVVTDGTPSFSWVEQA